MKKLTTNVNNAISMCVAVTAQIFLPHVATMTFNQMGVVSCLNMCHVLKKLYFLTLLKNTFVNFSSFKLESTLCSLGLPVRIWHPLA